ncbi:MAG: YicC family protein [Deltaproteobacteria bacterium]|nr:YicC family protein [Deltaproteobacteria bacterium]
MYSMTGMGRASGKVLGFPVRVEIKSVNHRFCEVNFRAPGKYAMLELLVQKLVKNKVSRGRVDVFIFEEKAAEMAETDSAAYQNYYDYLTSIQKCLGLKAEIDFGLLVSGAASWSQKSVDADEAWSELKPVVESALKELASMRKKEGDELDKFFKESLLTLQKITKKVEGALPAVQKSLEDKLRERIGSQLQDEARLDEQRLHSEVLYYLDRLDISEEIERLHCHFKHLDEILHTDEPLGRKVDFLVQELNREFNTIASKSQNAEISQTIVEAKSTLEKFREQIQNVE